MIEISNRISFENIEKIVFEDEKIVLSEQSKKEIENSYRFLQEFASDKVIYGINTGFGPMARYRVCDKSRIDLQYNLIRSHCAGIGEPLPDVYVKAAMLARLGTFVQAQSGVHLDLPLLLIEFINRGMYPFVPQHGSVGASGDLVQLAHIALNLIGEGQLHYKNEWRKSSEVFKDNNLKPLAVSLREGLAMTNGTSVMTGIGLVNLVYAKRLLNASVMASVMMNEIAASYSDFMSETLNVSKRHNGQAEVAKRMREIAVDSERLQKREDELYGDKYLNDSEFKHKVQPYYSLRCVPQVLGPVLDTIENAIKVLTDETNSTCDNPVVDVKTGSVYHGGNFHGDYVSIEMDKLKIAITKLSILSERQLNYLLHDRINEILPPFLNLGVLGLNFGLQGAQFTATSTTAESQTLCNPMSVHNIPNNNDNQDVVSMGANSALITKRVIDNAFQVMAIQYMALVQAIDCLGIKDKLSTKTRTTYNDVRKLFPLLVSDVPLYPIIEDVKNFIINNFKNNN
jgi:histidine ammonia-lyase